jgi:hypothetical protein
MKRKHLTFFCVLVASLGSVGLACADQADDKAVEVVLAKGGVFLPNIDNPPRWPDYGPANSDKITLSMEDCQATRQRFPKTVLEALTGSAKDSLVKRGIIEVEGKKYTLYVPKAKVYSVKNTSKKDDPFENTSTLLVIDQNGDGKFTLADNWFANLPVRLGDKMFDIVDIVADGSKITLKPSKSPLRGIIVGRVCPQFSFTTAEEKSVSRESLAGKPFILEIWSIT